jgi:hypothetical protein
VKNLQLFEVMLMGKTGDFDAKVFARRNKYRRGKSTGSGVETLWATFSELVKTLPLSNFPSQSFGKMLDSGDYCRENRFRLTARMDF